MKHHSSLHAYPPNDQRQTLHEQQVLLFWLLSKILRRLARSIQWGELDESDKRRLNATLTLLESDVHLIRLITSSMPRNSMSPSDAKSATTTKAASPEGLTPGR